MSRRNIEDLPFPPPEFNASRSSERADGRIKLETLRESSAEDDLRKERLIAGKGLNDKNRVEAKALASRIHEQSGNVGSMASSLFMRCSRIIVVGALWHLVRAMGYANVSTFTIIPRSWEFPANKLPSVDPRILLERFRQKLIRASKGEKGGWLFAAIHGEYEPTRDVFQLHIHGIVNGNLIKALDRLRKRSDFKKVTSKGQTVYLRVRISRKPLTDLPEPLTYMLQPFWPSRTAFKRGEDDLSVVR